MTIVDATPNDTYPFESATSVHEPEGDLVEASPEVLRQQASMILTAMDAASRGRGTPPARYERREEVTRIVHRQEASLTLHADFSDEGPRTLFIRDVEPRAAGFIVPERLPLGYGGTLEMRDLEGNAMRVGVTIVRCRACYGGWYEGAAYFHQPKPSFGPTSDRLA